MLILVAFLAAAATALLVTPAVVRFVTARGLYGHVRGASTEPRVPRLGGVAVCAAASVGIGAALLGGWATGQGAVHAPFFAGILVAGWLLFSAGILDDLRDLRPLTKLAAQCAAALVAYGMGFRIEALTFGEASVALGALSLPLTLLWVVGVTNAFNLIDGLDGLATGIGVVALGTTLVVAVMLGNAEVALACAALVGALLGFLRYNFRPARIFLGDSGSLFVGFMVAVLSVHGSTKSATAVLAAVPLLVMAIPLLDTALAIVRRWLRGHPVLGADDRHLHHRLIAVGLTHVRAVVLMYVAAALLAALAVVLAFGPPRVVAVATVGGALASVAVLLVGIRRLGYHEFVEAGAVLTSGVMRIRQSIRDQIHARDVANVLARAESLAHMRAILDDNAAALGLLRVTVCTEDAREGGRNSLPAAQAGSAWKLECPVGASPESAGERLVLLVWTEAPDDARLVASDRVAHVLAGAVRGWLARARLRIPAEVPREAPAAPPRPARVAAVASGR